MSDSGGGIPMEGGERMTDGLREVGGDDLSARLGARGVLGTSQEEGK